MAATPPSEDTRVKWEQENNRIWVNRLPTEILSRIFVIGEDMDQDNDEDQNNDGPILQFQELVAQVCRKWRAIALSMPMLWTYISISGLKSFDSAAAFIERSGAVPLEIEVDLSDRSQSDTDSEEDSDDQEPESNLAQETLDFLVSKGAVPSRWARLAFWFEKPKTMFTVIDFLSGASLDHLRKLSLVNTYIDPITTEDYVVEAMQDRNASNSSMFRSPPPLLRELELMGVPSSFFFAKEDASPVFHLTHLDLGFLLSLPPLMGLHTLLVQNPRLESLCLDTGMIETTDFEQKNIAEIRVRMPFLRRFSLQEPISVGWGLSVIQMIDAPELEAFALNLDQSQTFPDSIPLYIAFGKEIFDREPRPETRTTWRPIYPVLKHLALGPFTGSSSALLRMLRALGTITRLDWELQEEEPEAINSLLEDPEICPRLEHIRVHGVNEAELVDLVQSRIRNGAPLKTVEVNSRNWSVLSQDAKAQLSKLLDKFGSYVDDNESDSDGSASDTGLDSDWTDTGLSDVGDAFMGVADGSGDEGIDDEDDSDISSIESGSDPGGDP